MRSPADMQTIQIEITNACDKRCSNCTRFCGNHKKPFFMDYETFVRAVDSLEGYGGTWGVMGGEPTLHPEFERFLRHLEARGPLGNSASNRMIFPQREFIKETRRREFESRVLREEDGKRFFQRYGYGLWSNMGPSYRKHYELIQDVFPIQFLNDHVNPSYHQPGLVARKDLQIPDGEWERLRDRCWVQNEWSASVTPKGAFFCEIAAALDMLFDGPGGWPIVPGWWRRKPEEFGNQLHWCELCGFAIDTFMRDAEDEMDDVSPTLYRMLREKGSPRLLSGRTNLLRIEDGKIAEESKAKGRRFSPAMPYMEHFEDRFNEKNRALFVDAYETFRIPEGEGFGRKLNQAISSAREWILLCGNGTVDEDGVRSLARRYVLNPGTLHLGDGFALFSKQAQSLRILGYDRIAPMRSRREFVDAWRKGKVFFLSELEERTRWKRGSIQKGKRYAVWGTGLSGSFLMDLVRSSGGVLSIVVDKDAAKEGKEFYGVTIRQPSYLAEHAGDYDCLLVGHYYRFDEIREEAAALGIDAERILLPYEV